MLEQPHIMHPYFFVEDNKESPLFPMIQDFYSKIMARKKNKERDCWSYKPIPYECFPEYGKVGTHTSYFSFSSTFSFNKG